MKKLIYFFIAGILLSFNTNVSGQDPTDSTDVYGCTDPTALNYNEYATIDDGTCIYLQDTTGTDIIYGCTDPTAINYNELATIDDGSCIYNNDTTNVDIYGCTDPTALNYNSLATIDDGSCIYNNDTTNVDIYGCTDSTALNYNPYATIDDGTCIYWQDTTGTDIIYGCTDPIALNYNPLATLDDGSCIYETGSSDCDAYFYVSQINTDLNYVTIVNQSTGNSLEYLWDFGDGNSSTDEYPTHVYDTDGLYMVCLTITSSAPADSVYCTSSYCDTIGMTLSIPGFAYTGFTLNTVSELSLSIQDENVDLISMNLYPNPANDNITLSYTLLKNEQLTTSIYDLSGRMIRTWTKATPSGQHEVTIDINDLSPGLYQIELRNNQSRNILRFQVIK